MIMPWTVSASRATSCIGRRCQYHMTQCQSPSLLRQTLQMIPTHSVGSAKHIHLSTNSTVHHSLPQRPQNLHCKICKPCTLAAFSHRNKSCAYTHTAEQKEEAVTFENIFDDSNREKVREQLGFVQSVRPMKLMGFKESEVKVAAVLVPMCVIDGEPSLLFTLRSSSLRAHRGEVSFPGGVQDDTDTDIIHTALRETFEEIGLNPRHFEIWGTLSPSPSSGKSLAYPVLARYTKDMDLSSLKLNEEEVEDVFTYRIRDLCDNTKIGSTQFRTKPGYTIPVYLGGQHRIWGLTAVILHQVLTTLAPGLYTYKVRHVA